MRPVWSALKHGMILHLYLDGINGLFHVFGRPAVRIDTAERKTGAFQAVSMWVVWAECGCRFLCHKDIFCHVFASDMTGQAVHDLGVCIFRAAKIAPETVFVQLFTGFGIP